MSETKPAGAIRKRPHSPKMVKRLPWPICAHCGLVYLKNDITHKLVKAGCWLYEDEV